MRKFFNIPIFGVVAFMNPIIANGIPDTQTIIAAYGGQRIDALFGEASKCNLETVVEICELIGEIPQNFETELTLRFIASNCDMEYVNLNSGNNRDPRSGLSLVAVALLFRRDELAGRFFQNNAMPPLQSALERQLIERFLAGAASASPVQLINYLPEVDIYQSIEQKSFVIFKILLRTTHDIDYGLLLEKASKSPEFLDLIFSSVESLNYDELFAASYKMLRQKPQSLLEYMINARCGNRYFGTSWVVLSSLLGRPSFFRRCINGITNGEDQLDVFATLARNEDSNYHTLIQGGPNDRENYLQMARDLVNHDFSQVPGFNPKPGFDFLEVAFAKRLPKMFTYLWIVKGFRDQNGRLKAVAEAYVSQNAKAHERSKIRGLTSVWSMLALLSDG